MSRQAAELRDAVPSPRARPLLLPAGDPFREPEAEVGWLGLGDLTLVAAPPTPLAVPEPHQLGSVPMRLDVELAPAAVAVPAS